MATDDAFFEDWVSQGVAVVDEKTGRKGCVIGGARASGKRKARLLILWEDGTDETRISPFGVRVDTH
ncbi:hypothetical protein [Rhodomicrobium lacus]|uniref:hypothetical protein n=1 Tax=Rhodomicrobium lacus TaxID=2498452 RepID=UPI000F8E8A04|nr:hypothetical protein [Rhodomicrobium lacus]